MMRRWKSGLVATAGVALWGTAARLHAQAPGGTVALVDSVMHEIRRLGAAHGESVWPGYRPDTFAFAFVVQSRGTVLAGWEGAMPVGFTRIEGHPGLGWREQRDYGAASTAVQIAGHPVAQVVMRQTDGPYLVSTAFHEGFHVFENLNTKAGRKFGEHENAFNLSSYPLLDVDNETGFALEGRMLAAGLRATSASDRIRVAQEFVATRRARHRQLEPDYANFDRESEMNEGLAEYALVRALQMLVNDGPPAWKPVAAKERASLDKQLSDLTGNPEMSIRFRYYATGPAQALLLDALVGDAWKRRVLVDNMDLQDALGAASGLDAPTERAYESASRDFDLTKVRAEAAAGVQTLQATRRRRVDSVLAAPGVRLVLAADSLANRDFNSCGFDPQNHLVVTRTLDLQARWWKPCGGASTMAELSVPSVHDKSAGTVTAVIGPEADVRLSADDQPLVLADGETRLAVANLKLESPRATVRTGRADVMRRGATLTIRPRP